MLLSNTTTVGQQLNRNQIAGGGWSGCQRFMAISTSFEEFLELTQYIDAFYTISCYVPFNVPVCQMTPRTEESSHKSWQRLKLACPRFVHYDEQIMFLHVYWLFCQMVHQAFQDHTKWMHCLMETVKKNTQQNSLMWRQIFNNEGDCYSGLATEPGPCTSTTWPGFPFYNLFIFYQQHLPICLSVFLLS